MAHRTGREGQGDGETELVFHNGVVLLFGFSLRCFVSAETNWPTRANSRRIYTSPRKAGKNFFLNFLK
jgi:hypothetical protein